MKAAYWLAAGAAVLAVAAGILFFRDTPPTNYPSAGTDIIAFGDSLVAGTGSSDGHDFVSLLSQATGKPIINLGHPGDTTADGLARVGELDAYKPKVVLLLLGGNDYLKRVPQEETFQNLANIIKNIQGRGAVVLLLGVRGGLLGDHFADEYKNVSRVYRTAYVSDVLSGLIGDKKYMYDQIHPNDAGYAKVAARIAPVLLSLLQ